MSEHELWNELGNLYFLSGAYNQAAHAYERSIQTDTRFGRPYSNLALTYVQQGRFDEAIDLYRRSIELLVDQKEKAISWNRLGSVYRHLKDYSKAVIAFQEADELDPRSADDFPPDSPAQCRAPEAPSSLLDQPVQPISVAVEQPSAQVIDQPVAEVEQPPAAESADQPLVEVHEPPAAELADQPVAEVQESETDLDWWNVDEKRVQLATLTPAPDAQAEADIVYQPAMEAREAEPQLEWWNLDERQGESASLSPAVAADAEPEVVDQPATEVQEPEPELEWWDVDQKRVESAALSPASAVPVDEDRTTSWTRADVSQVQQDLSQTPETGSLTTWGDTDFEDDFELWSPLDPEPDAISPDLDGDNISTWLPLPEEEPLSLDQLRVPPFVDELDVADEPPSDWNTSSAYHVISSADFEPLISGKTSVPSPVDIVQRSEIAQEQQKSWEVHEVDVAVEDRPANDFAVAAQEMPSLVETETVTYTMQPEPMTETLAQAAPELEPVTESVIEAVPESQAQVPDRDDEEMREIEMGIARFRRVVQINPRNAHAWDALGTLYKSAGLYKDAILAYQQAISNDPSKSLYCHHLGLVYACEGRDEDAIGAFQRVIEIDPEYSLAHATLGGYYRKMGLEELAQKHIGKAMKNIFDSENEYNRACLEAICGNADQAIQLLGVALKNKQTYVDWILRDPDLDFIRQDPRFKQLISEYTR